MSSFLSCGGGVNSPSLSSLVSSVALVVVVAVSLGVCVTECGESVPTTAATHALSSLSVFDDVGGIADTCPLFTMNDSCILNPDNSFVSPLIFLNNTHVFDLNQLQVTSNFLKPL